MPRSREAISTIKGYYFQFDYYILQLLCLQSDDASVCIEGVEDVDIIMNEFTEAVQCKYYEETRCVPSKVGEAIRPMLRHYANNKGERMYRYKLYGHYKSGMDTIPEDIDVDYAKEKLFTYKDKGNEHILYEELNLDDVDIKSFWTNWNYNFMPILMKNSSKRLLSNFNRSLDVQSMMLGSSTITMQ